MAEPRQVRILHVSDTHMLHRSIEATFPLPPADILIHTGDFTDRGGRAEFDDFNVWLGELRPRYKHIVVILGNHEWMSLTQGSEASIAARICASSSSAAEDIDL